MSILPSCSARQLLFFVLLSVLFVFGCRPSQENVTNINKDNILSLKNGKDSHQVIFADLEMGKTRIIQDKTDGYFDKVKRLDMQIQMATVSRGDRATLLKDYKAHLQSSVLEWNADEKKFATDVMRRAYQMVNKVDPSVFPKEIIMIKCNMNHYGPGVFYTRENTIVIPQNTLQQRDAEDFLATMIHEIFHIYARYNTAKRDELYKRIGYTKVEPPQIPEILNRRILLNPDGVDFNYGIRVKRKTTGQEITAMPIIYSKMLNYSPKQKGFFNYLQFHLFELEDGEIQVTRNGETNVYIKNITNFYEQIGTNTQYIIHPDEVLADNFKLVCYSEESEDVYKTYNIRPVGIQLVEDIKAILRK